MNKNTAVLCVLGFVVLLVYCRTGFSESYPSDLKITVAGGPLMPGAKNRTVIITSNGHGQYSEYIPANPHHSSSKEVFTLTASQLEFLWKTIQEENFFNLDPEYFDASVADGSYVTVTILADGKIHSVELQNAVCAPFLTVFQAINDVTPGDKDVIYRTF